MDVSNLLCLLVVRSFQSSICVVFLSYWRDLSKHVGLDLMSSSFLLSFLFCYNMMGVRDLLYRRLLWVWETCHTLSLFFWCPVLFYLSFLFCHIWRCERPVILWGMMGVEDLSCHVVLFPTLSPFCFSSFSVLASLLLFNRIIFIFHFD